MKETERRMFLLHAKLSGFQQRIKKAREDIAAALEFAPGYVATSWGKDSTVLLHLTQSVRPDVPAVFFTSWEQEMLDNYEEVIRAYCARFPTQYHALDFEGDRVPHKVLNAELWETWPLALIGMRAEESAGRRWAMKKYGIVHQYKHKDWKDSWRVCPLAWWTWRDVWAYTVLHDLPYLKSYDHPVNADRKYSRTCNLLAKKTGNTKGVEFGRIARLKQISPDYYRYLQANYPEIAANV